MRVDQPLRHLERRIGDLPSPGWTLAARRQNPVHVLGELPHRLDSSSRTLVQRSEHIVGELRCAIYRGVAPLAPRRVLPTGCAGFASSHRFRRRRGAFRFRRRTFCRRTAFACRLGHRLHHLQIGQLGVYACLCKRRDGCGSAPWQAASPSGGTDATALSTPSQPQKEEEAMRELPIWKLCGSVSRPYSTHGDPQTLLRAPDFLAQVGIGSTDARPRWDFASRRSPVRSRLAPLRRVPAARP